MNTAKMTASAAGATALLKALANRHRLLILCHLANGEKSVGELEELLGMRQPHLSQHLARLRRDGLVATRRNSRMIHYQLKSRAAAEVVRLLYELYCAGSAGKARPRRPRAAAMRSRGHARRG